MKAVQFNVTVAQFLALKALGAVSKSLYYRGPLSTVHMVDIPEPELPSQDWVKIKVVRCGVCASDINAILLNVSPAWSPFTSGPSVPGHEIAGRIVKLGSAVKGLSEGDLVAVCPVLNCRARSIEPECAACRQGLACCENFAEGKLAPGMAVDLCTQTTGGFSEFVIAHSSQVFKIPQGISPENAALVEPFSIALEAVLSNRPEKGEQVLIIGGGVIGNMLVQAIRALDIPCKITAAVSSKFTAELAKKAGADYAITGPQFLEQAAAITGGRCYKPLLGPDSMMCGFDRVYDCFSKSDSVGTAIGAVKTGGVISLVGISSGLKLDPTLLWVKLVTLKGTLYYGFHEWEGKKKHVFEIAIALLSGNRVKFEGLVTHKFTLDEYRKMLEFNINKGKYRAVKTMFVYE
jgi:(R,R)-butanediol dehydrogenase / meso-butanediol dehydrogenase / diacetyl reductase